MSFVRGEPQDWLSECTDAVVKGKPDPHPDRGAGPALAVLTALPDGQRKQLIGDPIFDQSQRIPDELFGTKRQDSSLTLGEMRRTEAALGSGEHYFAPLTAAERVRAFATFVSAHAHLLERGVEDFLPFARNHAAKGIVVEGAESILAESGRLWIACDSRPPFLPTHPAPLRKLLHESRVNNCALAADGRIALSCNDRNGYIRMWDVNSGVCYMLLGEERPASLADGHTRGANCVAIASGGEVAASCGADGTLCFWDLVSGERRLIAHLGPLYSCALTADARLALAVEPHRVHVVDASSGETVRMLGSYMEPSWVALTPDGKMAFDSQLCLWDVASGTRLRSFCSSEGGFVKANGVALTSDAKIAIAGGKDGIIRVVDMLSGNCLRFMNGHFGAVYGVAINQDGRIAVSAGADGTLRVWDVALGENVRTINAHLGGALYISITADGRLAISVASHTSDDRNTLAVWNLASGVSTPSPEKHSSVVASVALSADARLAVSLAMPVALKYLPEPLKDEYPVRIWDTATGQCIERLSPEMTEAFDVSLTAAGRVQFLPARYRSWKSYDGVTLWLGPRDPLVVKSVDGKIAMSADGGLNVRVLETSTGARLASYCAGAEVTALSDVSADGRFVCGTRTGEVHFLRMRFPPS